MRRNFLNQKLGKRASRQAALQKAKLLAEKTAPRMKPEAPRTEGKRR